MSDPKQREFVKRLFHQVKPGSLLKGLAERVTRLELTEAGAVVNLRQQAAMCLEQGVLESGKRTGGVFKPFWRSTAGTVFNTDALWRKSKGPGLVRVARRATLMLLSADDFEAELKVNKPFAAAMRQLRGRG